MAKTHPAHAELLPPLLRALLPYWALAMAIGAVYGTVFDNAFLFDDDLLIGINRNLRGWDHIGAILTGSTTSGAFIAGGFYRPVQMLLYLIVFQLGGGSTIGFHLLNLSLHTANACLMYRLGTKLNFRPWGVFIAALLWAVHPLHTEAVTYMSATADPLFSFFCLLSIFLLLPDITLRGIFAIIPLFLLGLMSKETAVMLPLLVMACLFLTQPERLNIRTYFRTWPLWIITLAFAAWRLQAKNLDGPQTYARLYQMDSFATLKLYADHPLYRIETFFATLPAYLKLLLIPTGLHMERSFTVFTSPFCLPVLTGIAMCGFALFMVARNTRHSQKDLPLAWGFLWFGAAHAPDSGILVPMNSLFLEHWMYLPTVGLFLGLAETLARLLESRRALALAASGMALTFTLALAIMAYAQNGIWHDPESFYNNIFSYGERSARARNNLALYYADEGRYADAIDQFKQAIDISDSYAETRHNLALTYLRLPDQRAHFPEAIDNLNRALELDPRFYRSIQTLGDIYAEMGDQQKALEYHQRAQELIEQGR